MLALFSLTAPATPGDVNLDGVVDSVDRDLIIDHILERALLSGEALENADANQDGEVNAADVGRFAFPFSPTLLEAVSTTVAAPVSFRFSTLPGSGRDVGVIALAPSVSYRIFLSPDPEQESAGLAFAPRVSFRRFRPPGTEETWESLAVSTSVSYRIFCVPSPSELSSAVSVAHPVSYLFAARQPGALEIISDIIARPVSFHFQSVRESASP